ncbi:MAG: chemotaxis response regulator protein-glutamate methylesterase, partial [Fimbriimonadaceae bacterium]|nr:chemotaxis response regulator protein-glutamate methylesterase [Alphaproteobacteria bacterium]
QAIAPHIGRIPVVITQHMPATFTAILAEHIAKETKRVSREGVDGEVLMPGQIYVAPGGKHMLIKAGKSGPAIVLDDGPQVNYCKPAVDPMFRSLVDVYGSGILSVVLTGMGSDGALGAAKISQAGGNVIAQDEKTSVVWGMPGATAAAGICMAVLPLDEIGSCVNKIIGGTGL